MRIIIRISIYNIYKMSFKAVFEVFLQIHQFTNIDLPCQGIFRLRASVSQKTPNKTLHAQPFEFMNPKPAFQSKKIPFQSQIEPPYFYSKAGIIKYSDESLELNDEVRFKLEVQSFPRLHSEEIVIQFQLLFQEISSSQVVEWEVVEKKSFRFQMLEHGICTYCEGEFIGNYSSKFSFTVFACLSNFQFGKYKLMSQIQAVWKEGEEGNIVVGSDNKKNSENVRMKELERSKVKNFQEFLGWVDKYYKQRVNNSLLYFYNTYVKNLRYYFYLAQQKLDQNSLIKQKKILKVPKQFLDLPNSSKSVQTEVSQKQFRNYMQKFEPKNLSAIKILSEINTIYADIYMFLVEVENEIRHGQLMRNKMSKMFQGYIKDRYGERVFKSVVRGKDTAGGLKENKKIAKKMREKQVITTVTYPIEDIAFLQSKQMMQFLFYQITYPECQVSNANQPPPLSNTQVNKKPVLSINESETSSQKNLSKILDQEVQSEEQIKVDIQQNQSVQNLNKNSADQQLNKNQGIDQAKGKENEESGTILSKIDIEQNENIKKEDQKKQTDQNIKIEKPESELIPVSDQKQPVFKNLAEQIEYLREQDRKQKQQKMTNLKKKYKEQGRYQSQDEDSSEGNNIFENNQNSEQAQKSFQNHSFQNNQPQSNISQIFNGISDIELADSEAPPELQNYKEQNMLIVLCHGFQGSSFDMSIILRGLKQVMPNACYLLSRTNEGETEGDIEEMGKRVAEEVGKYVRNYMDKNNVVVNFVGHSMGGIVARTAGKYLMKEFWNQFGFFCSLSSPHLGYLNGVDGMIKAGLWAILKFKPIRSLQQLKMDDEKEIRKSFLYKLSKQGNLKRFRKVILFSSFEDSYVSWNSARISAHTNKTSKSAKLEQEMVSNILGSAPIHRIDVNFNVQTKNLDSFIGRTAHINLIIQQSLFKIINSTIPDLFDLKKTKP